MRRFGIVSLAAGLLALAGCGDAVPIDQAALEAENDTRDATRQAEDVAASKVRAAEDAALSSGQQVPGEAPDAAPAPAEIPGAPVPAEVTAADGAPPAPALAPAPTPSN